MIAALAFIQNGWAAYSFAATLGGGVGVGLIVLALLGTAYLPAFIKRPLIGAGLALIVGAALYQAGQAKGAHEAFALGTERAIAAERQRAERSEKITADTIARAARDRAADQAGIRKLRELNDALAKDPRRDGVCLDRDLSRGLRAL